MFSNPPSRFIFLENSRSVIRSCILVRNQGVAMPSGANHMAGGIRWVARSDIFTIEAQSCLRARRKGDLLYCYLLSMEQKRETHLQLEVGSSPRTSRQQGLCSLSAVTLVFLCRDLQHFLCQSAIPLLTQSLSITLNGHHSNFGAFFCQCF